MQLLDMAALTVHLTSDYGELPAARPQSYGRYVSGLPANRHLWNCQRQRIGICLTSEIGCSVRRADSMAQKVQVLLVDDLDGSEATETVSFGLDGVSYLSLIHI